MNDHMSVWWFEGQIPYMLTYYKQVNGLIVYFLSIQLM